MRLSFANATWISPLALILLGGQRGRLSVTPVIWLAHHPKLQMGALILGAARLLCCIRWLIHPETSVLVPTPTHGGYIRSSLVRLPPSATNPSSQSLLCHPPTGASLTSHSATRTYTIIAYSAFKTARGHPPRPAGRIACLFPRLTDDGGSDCIAYISHVVRAACLLYVF